MILPAVSFDIYTYAIDVENTVNLESKSVAIDGEDTENIPDARNVSNAKNTSNAGQTGNVEGTSNANGTGDKESKANTKGKVNAENLTNKEDIGNEYDSSSAQDTEKYYNQNDVENVNTEKTVELDNSSDNIEAKVSEDLNNKIINTEKINGVKKSTQASEKISSSSVAPAKASTTTQASALIQASTPTLKSANNASNEEEGHFKIALRWGGTSNKNYSWSSDKNENKVIKLTFYYQNEVTPKAYAPGDLVVTIPGIGKLNRGTTLKATDIAADEYGASTKKRDWSYKYNSVTDTYTFYNNVAIEQGATFNGSFELLWQFNSRSSVNDYEQNLKASLTDGEETVESEELSINYESVRDTFYINKSARSITSADGLNRYVAEGKTVSDYAWVQYTFRYNSQHLYARALKNRYFIDTFPEGCVIAKDTNVIQNEDGTVSYKVQESSVPENSVRESTVIVGYPADEYVNTTVRNVVDLWGTYYEENEPVLLDTGTAEIELKRVQNRTVGIAPGKYMSPDSIYKEALENDINFSATLYATASTNQSDAGYTIAVADDLLEIYADDGDDLTNDYHVLNDDEYKFTSVTVPGKNSFKNANGYDIEDGNYTVKIYAKRKNSVIEGNLSSRAFTEEDLVYTGTWGNTSITQNLLDNVSGGNGSNAGSSSNNAGENGDNPENNSSNVGGNEGNTENGSNDVVAVKVEISGLTENIQSFHINVSGKINVSENVANLVYNDPSLIINHEFTELKDSEGNSLIPEITQANYSRASIYERDNNVYGKGLLRARDTIQIREKVEIVTPGYYYAKADIEPFSIDENVEYFITKLTHGIDVNNKDGKEINKVEIHGVTERDELEALVETLQLESTGLSFKKALPNDVDINEYIMERANIEKVGNEISVVIDFSDNPIVSKSFKINYTVDARLNYEDYKNESNPSYGVRTYSYEDNTGLNAQNSTMHQSKTMAQASDTESILLALASHQQLIKMVKTMYTGGGFVEENAVTSVAEEYTYRLKLRNGYNTLVNTEFIDILERAELTTVDGENPYNKSKWYGKFKNVNVKELEKQGFNTKVYYANSITPTTSDWILMESKSDGIWTSTSPENVKAVKIRIEGENGEEQEIPENSIIYVDINMTAPTKQEVEEQLQATLGNSINTENSGDSGTTGNTGILENSGDSGTSGNLENVGNTEITFENLTSEELAELKAYNTYTVNCDAIDLYSGLKSTYMENMPSNCTDVRLTEKEYNIEITKKDATSLVKLSGVTFGIYDESAIQGQVEGARATTGISGIAKIKGLKEGTYIIKEENTPDGYEVLSDYTLIIENNNYTLKCGEEIKAQGEASLVNNIPTISFDILNQRAQGSITVYKIDEYLTPETKEEIPLQGIEFELLDTDENVLKTDTTDENGNIVFENLAWGQVYKIREKTAKQGYELPLETIDTYLSKSNINKTVKMKNTRKTGSAILTKQDEINAETKIEGAKYGLYANSSIYDKEGNIQYEQDALIKEGTTNENGEVTFSALTWGDYYIKEIETVYGYELSNVKHEFTINAENVENIVEKIENEERSKAHLQLVKIDDKGNLLSGVEFGLFDEDDNQIIRIKQKTDEEGIEESANSENEETEKYITNEQGQLNIENLEWGNYYIKEISTLEGYELLDTEFTFTVDRETFRNNSSVTKVLNTETNEEVSIIKNIRKKGKVTLTKYRLDETEQETESEEYILPGAVYELYLASGEKVSEHTTDANGQIIIDDLDWNSYYFQEKEAPEGYSVSDKKIAFVVNSRNVSFEQQYSAFDKQETGEITINKTIPADTIYQAHGNPTFIFKIVGKDALDQEKITLYRTVTFAMSDVGAQNVNGNITKTIKIPDVSPYKYEITEEENYRYDVSSIIPVTNANVETTAEGTKGIIDLLGVETKGEITFENTKTSNSLLTDSKLTTNSTQSTYYLIGITAKLKEESYELGTSLSASDLIYTFYYSGGQEEQKELTTGVTLNGVENYSQGIVGDDLIEIKINYNGKTYKSEDTVKWIMPSDYFTYNVISKANKTIGITGINTKYTSPEVLYIPSEYNGYKVQRVGKTVNNSLSKLQNITNVKTVEIAEGIEEIGFYAFYYYNDITSINLPSTLKIIRDSAFYSCSSLESIVIPEGVTSIGYGMFKGCSSLTDINIPEGVTSIGSQAFYSCSSLTNVVIQNSVTSIGGMAFSNCRSLTSIVIPEGVTRIEDDTFNSCSSLANIEIPEGVTSIGGSAFQGCSSLTDINIPEGVTSIGNDAFFNCRSLTSINIPEGVTSIGNQAFYCCSSLTTVNYHGTEEQFSEISIGSDNEKFTNATINYNYVGD